MGRVWGGWNPPFAVGVGDGRLAPTLPVPTISKPTTRQKSNEVLTLTIVASLLATASSKYSSYQEN